MGGISPSSVRTSITQAKRASILTSCSDHVRIRSHCDLNAEHGTPCVGFRVCPHALCVC